MHITYIITSQSKQEWPANFAGSYKTSIYMYVYVYVYTCVIIFLCIHLLLSLSESVINNDEKLKAFKVELEDLREDTKNYRTLAKEEIEEVKI